MTPSPEQASKLEQWATETAAILAPELDEMGQFRVMIGLLQARALECRYLSGKMHILSHPLLNQLAVQFGDRSQMLEEYGMTIAKRRMELSSTGQGEEDGNQRPN